MREKPRRLPRIHSFLPHLSAGLTFSSAGGGTDPSVTTASGGDTSPCRGGFCVARSRRRGSLRPPLVACPDLSGDRRSPLRFVRLSSPSVGPTIGRPPLKTAFLKTGGRAMLVPTPAPSRRRGGLWPPPKAFPAHGEGGAKRRMRSLAVMASRREAEGGGLAAYTNTMGGSEPDMVRIRPTYVFGLACRAGDRKGLGRPCKGKATSSVIRRTETRRMTPSPQGEGFGRAVRERPLRHRRGQAP